MVPHSLRHLVDHPDGSLIAIRVIFLPWFINLDFIIKRVGYNFTLFIRFIRIFNFSRGKIDVSQVLVFSEDERPKHVCLRFMTSKDNIVLVCAVEGVVSEMDSDV